MAIEEYGGRTEHIRGVRAVRIGASGRLQPCLVCVIATGLVFGIGAAESRWELADWAKSGVETLLIGTSEAGLSFVIGYGLRAFVKLPV